MARLQDTYKITANEKLCAKFFRMSLDAKPVAKAARPGQFIHIRVQDSLTPFFRRPFSIYRAKGGVDILYEVVGDGTRMLSEKKKGERLDVLGPLGTPFAMPPKGTKQVVMVAGGIGVAPFLMFSDTLKGKGYDLVLLYGGRTKGHTFCMKAFRQNGVKVHKATDDGSVGKKGRVAVHYDKIVTDASTYIYTCGPRPMMASVQDFARRHGIRGQASCEEVMACGLGACLGCATKTTKGYKTVCGDGPVFDLDELIFKT